MDIERCIVIYTKVLTRLFSNAHQPYTNIREYQKIARPINEILHRLISDNGVEYAVMIIRKVSLATNKPFGPLDCDIAMEITKRGRNITGIISL